MTSAKLSQREGVLPEVSCPEPSPPGWSLKRPGLKVSLVGAILATVSATAALVYVPWSLISERNVRTIVSQTNEAIVLATSQEVRRLFHSTTVANQFIQNSHHYGLVDLYDTSEREAFFLSVLKANPNFSWVQFGYENGDFFGAQRLSSGELKTHFRDWQIDTQTTIATVTTYEPVGDDAPGPTLAKAQPEAPTVMNPPFFAPARPWYQRAIAQPGQLNWTVYVYRSSQTPGMDASLTLEDPTHQGDRAGVVAIGIELSQLSEFLVGLKDTLAGEVFILNGQREIVASTALETAFSAHAGTAQLKRLGEADSPLLRFANAALTVNPAGPESGKRFTYRDPQTQEDYFVSIHPLENLDWMVGTVVPADHYLAEINKSRQQLLGVMSVFIITTAGLAVWVSERAIARPILTIANAAADIEAEQFEPQSLTGLTQRDDEFGQLARVFSQMAEKVSVRQQSLKRQVKALRSEIDEVKRDNQVTEIMESDFFQELTEKANKLRQRSRQNRFLLNSDRYEKHDSPQKKEMPITDSEA